MTLLLNIDVPDIAAAEVFYVEAFGLKIVRRLTPGVVEMEGWPIRVFLLKKSEGSVGAPGDTRTYARHWTPIHIDVVVPDVAAAFSRAVACGATPEQAPTQAAYGSLAMLADPFGHGFCLIEFNHEGYEALAQCCDASAAAPARGPDP